MGADVAFAAGAYAPGTAAGQRLIAHELAHVAQRGGATETGADRPAIEQEAHRAAAQALQGGPAPVRQRIAPAAVLAWMDRDEREDRAREYRSRDRTRLNPDLGQRRYTDWDRRGSGGVRTPMDRAATETRLQVEIAEMRPTIPEWWDVQRMGSFDSWFYWEPGPFDFRGRVMRGWEVNYHFVSMAMAHQGWDWNETQAAIWSWNASQEASVNPWGGGGEMTDEMWFAAYQGFSDEQQRMAAEGRPAGAPVTR